MLKIEQERRDPAQKRKERSPTHICQGQGKNLLAMSSTGSEVIGQQGLLNASEIQPALLGKCTKLNPVLHNPTQDNTRAKGQTNTAHCHF